MSNDLYIKRGEFLEKIRKLFSEREIVIVVGSILSNKNLKNINDIDVVLISRSNRLSEEEIGKIIEYNKNFKKKLDIFLFVFEEYKTRLLYKDFFLNSLLDTSLCLKGCSELQNLLATISLNKDITINEIIRFNIREAFLNLDYSVNLYDNFKFELRKNTYLNNFSNLNSNYILNFIDAVLQNAMPRINYIDYSQNEFVFTSLYAALTHAHIALGYLVYIFNLAKYNRYLFYKDILNSDRNTFPIELKREIELFSNIKLYKDKIKKTKGIEINRVKFFISDIYKVFEKRKEEIYKIIMDKL